MPEFKLIGKGDQVFQGLDAFTQAYIEAAFFTEEETLGPSGTVAFQQLHHTTLDQMIQDCTEFQHKADLANIPEHACCTKYGIEAQAGHDFWLTRNGHGAGFWDGDWREPYATALDRLAKRFPEIDLYRGQDGAIHS